MVCGLSAGLSESMRLKAQALEAARRDVSSKSRLYTMLGFFSGTVTALILI